MVLKKNAKPTPKQLAEQRDSLLAVLREAEALIPELVRQIPNGVPLSVSEIHDRMRSAIAAVDTTPARGRKYTGVGHLEQTGYIPAGSDAERKASAAREMWERTFPRLLLGIRATQDKLDIPALAESMDLTVDEVNELFDRAAAELGGVEMVEGRMIACYENGDEQGLWYTVLYLDCPIDYFRDGMAYETLHMSAYDPLCWHGHEIVCCTKAHFDEEERSRRIAFETLPEDCRKLVRRYLKEPEVAAEAEVEETRGQGR